MFNIDTYLEKFSSLLSDSRALKKVVIEEVKKEMGVEIEPTKVDIRDGVVHLSTSPLIKNEIFLKKTTLLQKVEERVGSRKVVDIR